MNAAARIADDASVLRRPHFAQVGDELFFLVSRRPFLRLSAAEASIWNALADTQSVAEIRARQPADADSVLRRFADAGLCEIVPPVTGRHRRRILVFEPHSDDAVLSVGGTMWLRRHECEFVLVTVAGVSNFTSYFELDREYFDVEQVSALRRAEGELAAAMLGGQYRTLDQSDASLRYCPGDWSLDWYRRHKRCVSEFVEHHSGPDELRQWIGAIRQAVTDVASDEIWFPLGGLHTDHQLTRNALLTLMRDEPALFDGLDVRMYQDVPYAGRSAEYVVDALVAAGADVTAEVVSIASVIDEKSRLMSVYASQFKLDAVLPGVEQSVRSASAVSSAAERLWRIAGRPAGVEVSSLRRHEPTVRRVRAALVPWAARHRDATRVRLLLIAPAGRWKEDMGHLLRVFPAARFDVYVASDAEVAEFASPRIRVTRVGMSRQAWALVALRITLGRPVPTLVVPGRHRPRMPGITATAWHRSDPVVVPRMDDVVAALELAD